MKGRCKNGNQKNIWRNSNGSGPQLPVRGVNLPPMTRNLMILEEAASKEVNPLTSCGYESINVWRRINFCLGEIMHEEKGSSFQAVASRHNKASATGYVWRSSKNLIQSEKLTGRFLEKEHRQLGSVFKAFIEKHPVSQRKVDKWKRDLAEGLALQDPPQDYTLASLLRTLSEWKLTPNQLLFEMEKDFTLFADPAMQSLVFLLFFRSPVENNEFHLGAGKLISKDEALRENCGKFIQRGLAHFERAEHGKQRGPLFL